MVSRAPTAGECSALCIYVGLVLFLVSFIFFCVRAIPDIQRKNSFAEGVCSLQNVKRLNDTRCSALSQCRSQRTCSGLACDDFPMEAKGTFFCCNADDGCRIEVGDCSVFSCEVRFDDILLGNQTQTCPLHIPDCIVSAAKCFYDGHHISYEEYKLSSRTIDDAISLGVYGFLGLLFFTCGCGLCIFSSKKGVIEPYELEDPLPSLEK